MDNSCLLDLLIRCFAMTEPEDLNFTAFTDLCRLCSLKSGPRLHIFDKEADQRQILFKLRTCLPTMISKDDFLPKKICERCITRLEQLYEWRQSVLNTDSVLRNYAESMRIVTSTINFQDKRILKETSHICEPNLAKNAIECHIDEVKKTIISDDVPSIPSTFNKTISDIKDKGLDKEVIIIM